MISEGVRSAGVAGPLEPTLWDDEIGFSNWLHANIAALGTAIGIEIVAVQREARVGRLSADLLAQIARTNDQVIIENQVYAANHGHFGQVLTYAAHYDARVIVWIAARFRDEYRRAVAWLNTLSTKRFFAVELQVIDGMPHLDVVAGPQRAFVARQAASPIVLQPSADALTASQPGAFVAAPFAVPSSKTTSPGQLVLNAIFERMADLLTSSSVFPRLRKPTGDRNYYVIATGPSRNSEWAVTFENVQVGVALVFNDPESAKSDLALVQRHQAALDAAVDGSITYESFEGRIKTKAILYRPFSYEQRSQRADEIAMWCVATITSFAGKVIQLGVFA